MQICSLLQTDNHTSTTTQFFTSWMPFLPPNQQHQSTEGIFKPSLKAISKQLTTKKTIEGSHPDAMPDTELIDVSCYYEIILLSGHKR